MRTAETSLPVTDWAGIESAILEKGSQKSTSLQPLAVPVADPVTPEGYQLAFGPLAAASSAPGVRLIHQALIYIDLSTD